MQEKFTDFFICPECGNTLALTVFQAQGPYIEDGLFTCPVGHAYALIRGVPRLLAPHTAWRALDRETLEPWLAAHAARLPEGFLAVGRDAPEGDASEPLRVETARRYAFMWRRWNTTFGLENQQELERMLGDAFSNSEVSGQVVLDAGTGQGRFVQPLLDNGAQIVVSADLGASVELAEKKYRGDARVVCIQSDIYSPPLRPVFDTVLCLGAMQHLPDPAEAFRKLLSLSKDGGRVLIWCYGESTLRRPLRLLRAASARLPLHAIWTLAFVLALPRHMIHGLNLALSRAGLGQIARQLPFGMYKAYDLDMFHINTFDHLSAAAIHFFSRRDIEGRIAPGDGTTTRILARHAGTAAASWVVDCKKAPASETAAPPSRRALNL